MTLNHNGKVAIAPCGHTGETIIGTYVRCLIGCEGAPLVSQRGVPGHVDNCACKPCQFRRVTTHIILRDKDGKDWMKVDWDGIVDEIHLEATKSGSIKAFHFLDKDGKIIAKGMTTGNLVPGEFHIKPNYMIDTLVMVKVVRGTVYQSTEAHLDYALNQLANYGYGLLATAPVPAPAKPGGTVTGRVSYNGTPVVVKGP